jgi:hypothetical protein
MRLLGGGGNVSIFYSLKTLVESREVHMTAEVGAQA